MICSLLLTVFDHMLDRIADVFFVTGRAGAHGWHGTYAVDGVGDQRLYAFLYTRRPITGITKLWRTSNTDGMTARA